MIKKDARSLLQAGRRLVIAGKNARSLAHAKERLNNHAWTDPSEPTVENSAGLDESPEGE